MSAICPKLKLPHHFRRQAGFALVSGIFILVILAVLATYIVTISGLQQTSTSLDVLGSRAYHAARSGIEWGAYQVTNGVSGTPFAQTCATTPNSQVVAMTGTLANFVVTVDCTAFIATERNLTVTLYQITSTATHGVVNTPYFVERQIQAIIERQ